jgi:polyhydroxybutyrate depolymerase
MGGRGGGGTAGSAGGGAGTGGAAGAAACPATATATAGETTQTIMVGGRSRTFVRHIPPGYTGRTPVPVVIDFHPLGGTGASWKGSTGWGALADREGFIMIWPDGVSNSWNAGRCCRAAFEQNIDDVGFTRAIIAALARDACIDGKRVYASGCSNGGGMAFKVACDAADVIAAVAPVDFDCVTSEAASDRTCGARCAPSRPISEIQFRGTADTAVPYEGGLRSGGTTTFPGAQETFMSFGSINMCTGSPAALPGHTACQAYPMCGGDVDTVLCTVQNGTHCGSYQSFGIVAIAWEMFKTKALP